MADPFVKAYPGLFEGSLRYRPIYVRWVFLALLMLADEDGITRRMPRYIAEFAGVSIEECNEALSDLSSPDPESTDPACEGRRITRDPDRPNELIIVNFRKFRERGKKDSARIAGRDHDRRNRTTRHRSASRRGGLTDEMGREYQVPDWN